MIACTCRLSTPVVRMAIHGSHTMYGAEKAGIHGNEIVNDNNTLESSSSSNSVNHAFLTEEELGHEKKLKRKIDSIIMPVVVLVSL